LGGRTVVEISDNKIVKFGNEVDEGEYHILMQLKEIKGFPSPSPLFFVKDGPMGYLIMSKIEGSPLSVLWKDLSSEDLEIISGQLHDAMNLLRSIDGWYIGSVGGGGVRDMRRDLRKGSRCSTIAEFNSFLTKEIGDKKTAYKDFLRSLFEDDKDCRFVLTHGDLSPRNLIIHNNRLSGIVDWECGGWYPEYWEYVKAMTSSPWSTGWPTMVDKKILTRYPEKYAIDRLLDKYM
jgi:aminoglycoside phosphotransferase (APT) family kinase protein